jgi:hypothetical protein
MPQKKWSTEREGVNELFQFLAARANVGYGTVVGTKCSSQSVLVLVV